MLRLPSYSSNHWPTAVVQYKYLTYQLIFQHLRYSWHNRRTNHQLRAKRGLTTSHINIQLDPSASKPTTVIFSNSLQITTYRKTMIFLPYFLFFSTPLSIHSARPILLDSPFSLQTHCRKVCQNPIIYSYYGVIESGTEIAQNPSPPSPPSPPPLSALGEIFCIVAHLQYHTMTNWSGFELLRYYWEERIKMNWIVCLGHKIKWLVF